MMNGIIYKPSCRKGKGVLFSREYSSMRADYLSMLRSNLPAVFGLAILICVFVAGCSRTPQPAVGTAPTSVPVRLSTVEPTVVSVPLATVAPTNVTAPTLEPVPTNAPVSTAIGATPTLTSGILTVVDSANRKVTLTGKPQRIVSLAPSTTEMVYALGAGDRMVGADTFSDYPAAAKDLPRISDGFNQNYEQIVALKPDLVLAAGITAPEVIKKARGLEFECFGSRFRPHDF